jgi:DNA polymerase-4
LKLTDLTGIAERNQARLNSCGIYTPLDFLDAPAEVLRRQVFKSVCGEDWYKRLRGHEVDDFISSTKSVGRQYVLDEWQPKEETLRARLSYMSEAVGVKLRYNNLAARGVHVYVRYQSGDYWYERKMFKTPVFTGQDVFRRATLLFNRRPHQDFEREMGVTCYGLVPSHQNQVSLLEEINKEVHLTEAMDYINNRYGEFSITYLTSMPSRGLIKQKIPFGSTRYFDLLCKRA